MTMTIQAVFEGGVLRPLQPLDLEEGETVDLTIAQTRPPRSSRRAPTAAEEDYARRLKAAKSLNEMFAVMGTAPPSPEDDYDIVKAINESRRLTGFRMPDPAEESPR